MSARACPALFSSSARAGRVRASADAQARTQARTGDRRSDAHVARVDGRNQGGVDEQRVRLLSAPAAGAQQGQQPLRSLRCRRLHCGRVDCVHARAQRGSGFQGADKCVAQACRGALTARAVRSCASFQQRAAVLQESWQREDGHPAGALFLRRG